MTESLVFVYAFTVLISIGVVGIFNQQDQDDVIAKVKSVWLAWSISLSATIFADYTVSLYIIGIIAVVSGAGLSVWFLKQQSESLFVRGVLAAIVVAHVLTNLILADPISIKFISTVTPIMLLGSFFSKTMFQSDSANLNMGKASKFQW